VAFQVELTSARRWTDGDLADLFAEGFPDFVTADQAVKPWIGRVRECFTGFDLMLLDADDRPAATGWGVPIAWSGEAEALPRSFAQVLQGAVELYEAVGQADTLVICGAVVHPQLKGSGAAAALLEALRDLAGRHGLARVVAPVRPTHKHLYPLIPIAEYAAWVRPDGLPFDPWLRLHVRLGGRVIGLAPQAQIMTGTVAQWQAWTGLALPGSGRYVVPRGLEVLTVDTQGDQGVYVEPNVWVRHR
jgi:GNAT superfamily N-acetyltransferase